MLGICSLITTLAVMSLVVRIILSYVWDSTLPEAFGLVIANTASIVGVSSSLLGVLLWALHRRAIPNRPGGSNPKWKRLVAACIGSGAALVGVAAVLVGSGGHGRLSYHGEWGIVSYQPDHDLGITCDPPCPPSRSNNLGYRDEPFDLQNRSGKARVALLGDSFVFGYRLGDGGRLDIQMERILKSGDPSREWEVLNLGVEGFNFFSFIRTLRALGPRLRADFVVIALDPTLRGDLDSFDPWARIDREGEVLNALSHLLLVSGDLYRANARRKLGWQVKRGRPIPDEIRGSWDDAVRTLHDLQAGLGFQLIMFSYTGPTEVFRDVEKQVELRLVGPAFRWQEVDGLSILDDPARHPTAEANRMFADAIVGAILSR